MPTLVQIQPGPREFVPSGRGPGPLTDALRVGAEQAALEMRDERGRFAASVERITDVDERGQVGVFQNALEKVFSDLEPARSVYVDADPACRFVTQRADPAAP